MKTLLTDEKRFFSKIFGFSFFRKKDNRIRSETSAGCVRQLRCGSCLSDPSISLQKKVHPFPPRFIFFPTDFSGPAMTNEKSWGPRKPAPRIVLRRVSRTHTGPASLTFLSRLRGPTSVRHRPAIRLRLVFPPISTSSRIKCQISSLRAKILPNKIRRIFILKTYKVHSG